jgi:hypothetical protein
MAAATAATSWPGGDLDQRPSGTGMAVFGLADAAVVDHCPHTVTATATDDGGNASEFSAPKVVSAREAVEGSA